MFIDVIAIRTHSTRPTRGDRPPTNALSRAPCWRRNRSVRSKGVLACRQRQTSKTRRSTATRLVPEINTRRCWRVDLTKPKTASGERCATTRAYTTACYVRMECCIISRDRLRRGGEPCFARSLRIVRLSLSKDPHTRWYVHRCHHTHPGQLFRPIKRSSSTSP